MIEAVGYDVKKLKRIRIESVKLGDLADGDYRRMTEGEKREILERISGED